MPAGAKGKYKYWISSDGLIKLQGWARDGLSDEQIAHNVGISPSTLYEWKNKYPELSESLREGKDIPDRKVENALYGRCFNQIVKVQKTFKIKVSGYDADGKKYEEEHLETGEDEVVIPADIKAQTFWLSNRKPDEWRDKRDVDLNVTSIAEDLKKARERVAQANIVHGE